MPRSSQVVSLGRVRDRSIGPKARVTYHSRRRSARAAERKSRPPFDHSATSSTTEPRSPVSMARFTSWMAWVTWMSRGQELVQLKTVRQRQTPSASLRISSRSAAARSRESKMKRWALTIAAGPTYFLSPQNGGQAVVQQAQGCSGSCRRTARVRPGSAIVRSSAAGRR